MRVVYGTSATVFACLVIASSWLWTSETHSVNAADANSANSSTHEAKQFESKIAPLLATHCLECHDSASKKGGLDLSRKASATAGGESGKAIIAGKSDDSLLWQYVESGEMPPDNRPRLSEDDQQLLQDWIDNGATWTREVIDPSAAFSTGNKAVQTWMRRLTVPEYIETVRSAVGVDIAEDAQRLLPPDVRADGFTNTAYSLGVDLKHVEAYAALAELVVKRMNLYKFVATHAPCQSLDEECLRSAIKRIGKHLFRGPLEEDEVEVFVQLAKEVKEEGGDFHEAVQYIVEGMLQSPRFLYLVERQQESGAAKQIAPYELACRLSYILWGGPPDEELMRAADAGELADRRRVRAQVQRMLRDPRAVERSSQFIHEWLDLGRLDNLRPNRDRFPNWSDRLAADMREETLEYFRHVAWEQNRPLSDLLNAQVTFATPRLAEHYGLDWNRAAALPEPESSDSGPRRVTDGLLALYRFDEGRGETVRDSADAGKPIDLKIDDPSAVSWSRDGLVLNSPTLIASEKPPQRLIDAAKRLKAITLEAWITPADTLQAGPARILTLSADTGTRNFTLGQDGDKLEVRLRTTKTSPNGEPSLSSPIGTLAARPVHVVYTRDADGTAKIFVDGDEKASHKVDGDFATWESRFHLGLANELSKDRPWRGTLHLVAVYNRPLSAADVLFNHAAGPQGTRTALVNRAMESRRSREGLQALYDFNQGGGTKIRDLSGTGEPLDLMIGNGDAVQWGDGQLTVKDSTLIATERPAKRLIEAVKASQAITIEALVTPADTSQSGPARIITLSSGTSNRNVTLGQEKDKYDVRFRVKGTDANGIPGLSNPSGSVKSLPTHIVYTRDTTGQARLYIDGKEQASQKGDNDLSNWENGFRLTLANETSSDRPWRGTFHYVAIYNRALSADEARSKLDLTPQEVLADRAASEPGLARFDLSDVDGRGGLLTQGSVLTVGGDEASMVSRGLFVLHDLLYSRVGNPPPCADTTPIPPQPGRSQRMIAMERIADTSCGGCHVKFEPLAFSLERFDGIGAYHETDEHGNELRDDGEITFPGEEQPVSFDSSAEFMNLLADSERVHKCIARKVTQFAIGRPLVDADSAVVDEINTAAEKDGGTYASLITAVVMSELVQTTQSQPPP